MNETLILKALRRYIRFLRTDKDNIGIVERWLRALLLIVPLDLVYYAIYIRAKFWGPITVDGMTEDGIHLRCQLPDVVQTYVYLFGTWEPDLAAFLRRRLRPGDTFVDVGANVGCVTALASRLVGPRGTVVAIEPSPPVIAALKETVATNDLANVRVVAAAVSDREHELPLFAGPNHNIGSTATVAHGGLQEEGRVRAAPLGSLVTHEELATTRVIKIDVEGAEDRVLTGMVACLDALGPEAEFVVELSPTWWTDPHLRPIDVLRPFLDRGFCVYLLPNDYSMWRYLWPRNVRAPERLRDFAILNERRTRIDVVLSRHDVDAL